MHVWGNLEAVKVHGTGDNERRTMNPRMASASGEGLTLEHNLKHPQGNRRGQSGARTSSPNWVMLNGVTNRLGLAHS